LLAKQLQWRCRRGVRELDVLFTQFVEQHYPDLSEEEQQAFHRLLDVQDPLIMDWLFNRDRSDDQGINDIISQLQDVSSIG